jgi:hypothetical protein
MKIIRGQSYQNSASNPAKIIRGALPLAPSGARLMMARSSNRF